VRTSNFKPKLIIENDGIKRFAKIIYKTPTYVVPVDMGFISQFDESRAIQAAAEQLKMALIKDIIDCEIEGK
jgi:hypothetical protein